MCDYETKISNDTETAVDLLRSGQLVALPTETVYGLAANALDEAAVLAIFEAKQRPHFDPLICHVRSVSAIDEWVSDFPEVLRVLADAFMPGPLTLLLPKRQIIPDLVTSGLDRVAIRVPAHPVALEVLAQLSFPLAAPSANPFGYVSPTTAQHVFDQLGGKLPFILDGGSCAVGLESTIVGLENEQVTIYRLGGLSIESIEAVLGTSVSVQLNQSSNPHAPGQLKSHYAPRKPLILCPLDQIGPYIDPLKSQGVIVFDRYISGVSHEHQFVLSKDADLREAAQNLFRAIRLLDMGDFDEILATSVPDHDLGKAINDRLRRAASEL
jgi:L-threonylcarbamoyladenylate synthase